MGRKKILALSLGRSLHELLQMRQNLSILVESGAAVDFMHLDNDFLDIPGIQHISFKAALFERKNYITSLYLFLQTAAKVWRDRKQIDTLYIGAERNRLIGQFARWLGLKVVVQQHFRQEEHLDMWSVSSEFGQQECVHFLFENDTNAEVYRKIGIEGTTIYPCLDKEFIEGSLFPLLGDDDDAVPSSVDDFTCVMIGDLDRLTSLNRLRQIAEQLPKVRFVAMLRQEKRLVQAFEKRTELPDNLELKDCEYNIHQFLGDADLFLELDAADNYETWMKGILSKSMYYGVPFICTSFGLPLELLEQRRNGFFVNPVDLQLIATYILALKDQDELYEQFSMHAKERATIFSRSFIERQLESVFGVKNQEKFIHQYKVLKRESGDASEFTLHARVVP